MCCLLSLLAQQSAPSAPLALGYAPEIIVLGSRLILGSARLVVHTSLLSVRSRPCGQFVFFLVDVTGLAGWPGTLVPVVSSAAQHTLARSCRHPCPCDRVGGPVVALFEDCRSARVVLGCACLLPLILLRSNILHRAQSPEVKQGSSFGLDETPSPPAHRALFLHLT